MNLWHTIENCESVLFFEVSLKVFYLSFLSQLYLRDVYVSSSDCFISFVLLCAVVGSICWQAGVRRCSFAHTNNGCHF